MCPSGFETKQVKKRLGSCENVLCGGDRPVTKTNGRKPDGTFAPGNPGGPGRPKRTTETAYLLAMSEMVSLDDWREIIETAVVGAKAGDDKARAWLSKHLLGDMPLSMALALELVSTDPINHLLLSLTGHMIAHDTADLSTVQELADIIRQRRLDREATDIDRLLEQVEIQDAMFYESVMDDLGES
jgi:hypothetical protein